MNDKETVKALRLAADHMQPDYPLMAGTLLSEANALERKQVDDADLEEAARLLAAEIKGITWAVMTESFRDELRHAARVLRDRYRKGGA